MPADPLVSVIIPTYNRANLIQRAVRSVLAQTYAKFELIVVDDCSLDNTVSLVSAVQDDRVKVIRHQANQGEGASRNTGMQVSRGKYAAFLDSDDEWLPSKLERQVAALEASQAALCYCQTYLEETPGKFVIRPQRPYQGGHLLRYLICEVQAAMQSSGLVVHRDYWQPFETTFRVHTDWDWLFQLRQRTSRFVFVAEPLYYFHADAPVRESTHGTTLISKAEPFLTKYQQLLEAEPDMRRNLGLGYVAHAVSQKNYPLARSLLKRFQIRPSLFKRPHAFRLWWSCHINSR